MTIRGDRHLLGATAKVRSNSGTEDPNESKAEPETGLDLYSLGWTGRAVVNRRTGWHL